VNPVSLNVHILCMTNKETIDPKAVKRHILFLEDNGLRIPVEGGT